ncbi:AfsR/SARP family transcriptional regulator [Streptomyces sp. CBMA152]|uniref:AfsR/SARP family transcriptional regulator n=1 Tax=Streptomyces sp. CBMA152 TaxID=1896312 RepID=UPI00166073E6|nr:AfsR/SARP family transcriptional regulator [Streptomyces sp. CBMA152]
MTPESLPDESGPDRIDCGVLGPLRIGTGPRAEAVTVPPKIRTVLAMLVVHTDQVVPVSALMRELWQERPPVSGLRTLQTYVLNCRKLLSRLTGLPAPAITQDVLVTRAGGYGLNGAHVRLDWLEFQRLAERGVRVLATGDEPGGIELLDEALGLWHGNALADVPAGPVLESRRRLYEESRLGVIGSLAEARIRAGLHQEAITQLAAATSEYALHEGLHAHYIRALALGGRRAEALGVFQSLRARLISEIGIEPGHPLQQLQLTVLNSGSLGM